MQRVALAVVVVVGMAIAFLVVDTLRPQGEEHLALPSPTSPSLPPSRTDNPSPAPTAFPRPTPTPTVPRLLHVGIVAGHWQNDPGAICPDGLREVDINLDIARRVVWILQRHGYRVDLLAEFDPRLEGYQADALVSIHTDACNIPEASGFKVARVLQSAIPEEEDRLVECLHRAYAQRTELYYHANSITYDMREYHAFYEIDPQTPAAIIETGFMAADRELLIGRPDLVAQGIAEGIICFLEGEQRMSGQ